MINATVLAFPGAPVCWQVVLFPQGFLGELSILFRVLLFFKESALSG